MTDHSTVSVSFMHSFAMMMWFKKLLYFQITSTNISQYQ